MWNCFKKLYTGISTHMYKLKIANKDTLICKFVQAETKTTKSLDKNSQFLVPLICFESEL